MRGAEITILILKRLNAVLVNKKNKKFLFLFLPLSLNVVGVTTSPTGETVSGSGEKKLNSSFLTAAVKLPVPSAVAEIIHPTSTGRRYSTSQNCHGASLLPKFLYYYKL